MEGGYYADPEAECQAFHICGSDGNGGLNKFSFLCPNGTLMNQQYFVCDWWFNVDCSLAETLYSLNDEVAAERESYTGNDGADPGQDGRDQEQGGETRRPGQGQARTSDREAGGQGEYRGAGGRRQSGAGAPSGRTRTRGGSRGGVGQRGGSRSGGQRTQAGYLAPGSGGDYEDDVPADVGYGAPGGDQDNFEGAGDFPLLTEYSRNVRETELGQLDDSQIEIIEVEK